MYCNSKCMGVCIMLECDSQALSRCRPAVALPWSLSRRCPCLGSWSRASPTPHRHQPLLTPRKLENISDMWHIRYYFISKLTPDLLSKVKTTLTILLKLAHFQKTFQHFYLSFKTICKSPEMFYMRPAMFYMIFIEFSKTKLGKTN